MNKEYFKILKEINSHLIKKNEIQQKIDSETIRLTTLEQLREARDEEQKALKKELNDIEIHYLKLEKELNLLNKQKDQATSALNHASTQAEANAAETSLAFTLEKISKLEDEWFSLLEEKEQKESTLNETQEFLKGSLETYQEISQEVNEVVQNEQKNITTLLKRIELLKEELPEAFKTKLDNVLKKNLKFSPFTRLTGHSCEFCKLEVSRLDEENIEKNFGLKSCSGCGRLFIPKEASY